MKTMSMPNDQRTSNDQNAIIIRKDIRFARIIAIIARAIAIGSGIITIINAGPLDVASVSAAQDVVSQAVSGLDEEPLNIGYTEYVTVTAAAPTGGAW